MRRKKGKLSESTELLIAFISVILLILVFSSCNPVKKVLKDPYKFAIIKDTVIKRGYCKCDTSFVYITDTLETIDTLYEVLVDTLVINDSVVFWETKFHTITKTRTIRDTIKATVVDSSMAAILRKELSLEKEKSKENKSWKKMFLWAVGASIAFFLLLFKLK
jgi:hypothetical protein